jgi:hypothetical protein
LFMVFAARLGRYSMLGYDRNFGMRNQIGRYEWLLNQELGGRFGCWRCGVEW